ncbi:hypothetical protein FW781_06760 (plasmid) [Chryseobacterium panacisoli]|uniref:Uncharacterized protein n=1 Tax=Chryseobacterium panacisoli TaxID=1807141 RepID=A0A5D9A1B4_9FLAO|nr:hypothetical protein [Chryseobacterium panacisoli]TZF99624.1 hypothetical protein FW781_06760 [Chryseobacterium panacisoli]
MFLLLIMSLFISCSTAKEDLANTLFPLKKEKVLSGLDYTEKKSALDENLIAYQVKDMNTFSLYGQYFANEIKNNSATYAGKNYLELLGDAKDINGYKIHLYTQKESEKLEKLLLGKLGKPAFDKGNETERNIIWETSGKIYILNNGNAEIQGEKTKESDLLCLNTNFTTLIINATQATKYSEYLKFRIKNNKKVENYPYSVYNKEEN